MTSAKYAALSVSLLLACGGGGGESETDDGSTSSGGSETDGSSGAPTSTDGESSTGEPAPACEPGDLGDALEWSQSAAMLPGFLPALAAGPEDSVVLAGGTTTDDAFVELRDAQGAKVWSDVYAGAHGHDDDLLDVAVDPEGFVHVLVREVILNVVAETMGTFDARLVVLRYAPDGAHVWRWERERAPVEPWGTYFPEGRLAADGESIVVVEWAHNQPVQHVRLDAFGNLQAEVPLATPDFLSYRVRFDVGADGSAVLADTLESPERLWVGRFDAHGAPAWSVEFEGDELKPGSVFAVPGGAAYLTGSLDANPGLTFSLRKFAGDGAVEWSQPLPVESTDDIRFGGALRCDGALLLVGGTDKPPQPDNEWGQRRDLWVGLMGADGALLWSFEHEFGPPFSWGGGHTAAFTSSGAVVVSGSFLGEDGSSSRPWLGRLSGG
ncbi:hypothetical protein SAMN02745121_01287 [Nannocystis exedens]|uniref:PQQ-like domain-containing protein n=1 Tax=Nannocystis exedens TaxID=54 RepID=A0A1I1UT18_9BACT|nr:hypothetical protein [Nannocystis exedens]PCC72078.1 hypothetical protein NAEX_05157 [Nannocystis exedens]SFD73951.1 hypothetical protein SAMN02745121_01287 [Nannocystis exedens]